ncbi:MAG: hypothetical protein ACREBO_06420 [Novosphingobium sp.]
MARSPIVTATLVSGVLDTAFPMTMTAMRDGDPIAMWNGVAAGPFGDGAQDWGMAGSLAGLLVHFALMGLMAAGLAALLKLPAVARLNWVVLGLVYGVVTYLVMYGVVLPLRFGAPFPQTDPVRIATALFAHIVLVGLVMAWIFKRTPARA